MSSINFFDLSDGIDRFVMDESVPTGVGIRGLHGADVILGFTTADLVYGNDGSDEIAGGSEADTLQGGRGADLLFGNAGNDDLQGERGNDLLFGGQGNDLIQGSQGDDILAGEAGIDTIVGGDGSDAFVLDTRHTVTDPALTDIITDFHRDDDGDVFALTDGAGDALTEADLTLEASGSDTLVRLTATGGILARVQGASPDLLTGAFSTASATLDNTEPGATVLGLVPGGNTLSGFVGDEDYLDLFQFQVTQTSIIDFSLGGMSADADLLLYEDLNDDGELGGDEIISTSVRLGSADEIIENVTLDPGKYFLAVHQFEGETNYNLSINGVAGTVARDLAGERPSTARVLSLDGDVELHDYVGGTDGVDTYELEVVHGHFLDVFTNHQLDGVDVELTLWSDLNGNDQLDADEVIAQGTNEILQDTVDRGTYYVNVTAPGEATPYEILAISELGSRFPTRIDGAIIPGTTIEGTLDRHSSFDPNNHENHADSYVLSDLEAGVSVTLTQESEDFDAHLTVVDFLTGEVVAQNDDIDVAGENFNAQVSFIAEEGGIYTVYASSVDAPGLGDYTVNTTLTQTAIETEPRRSRNATVIRSSGPKNIPQNTSYQPLTGGQISPMRINHVNQGSSFWDGGFLAALTSTFGKIEPDLSNVSSKGSPTLNNLIRISGNIPELPYWVDLFIPNYTYEGFSVAPNTFTAHTTLEVPADSTGVISSARWANPQSKVNEASGQPIWPAMFEKAFAMSLDPIDGYARLSSSNNVLGLYSRLMGRRAQLLTSSSFSSIQTVLNDGSYMIAKANNPSWFGKRSDVITAGSMYSVHNAYENNDGEKLILLRNPHGVDNSSGSRAPEDPNPDTQDGFVTIKFETFTELFGNLAYIKP